MKLFRKRAVQAEVSISKVPLKVEWSANDQLRGQCGQTRENKGSMTGNDAKYSIRNRPCVFFQVGTQHRVWLYYQWCENPLEFLCQNREIPPGLPLWHSHKKSACQCRKLGLSLGWKDTPEEEMTTHSSIFAWKISWTEECGRPQSMGSQRVGHY